MPSPLTRDRRRSPRAPPRQAPCTLTERPRLARGQWRVAFGRHVHLLDVVVPGILRDPHAQGRVGSTVAHPPARCQRYAQADGLIWSALSVSRALRSPICRGRSKQLTAAATEVGYVQQPQPTRLQAKSKNGRRTANRRLGGGVPVWTRGGVRMLPKQMRRYGEGKKKPLYSTNNCPTASPRPGKHCIRYPRFAPGLPPIRSRPRYVLHTHLSPD
jgi:hypothetical protein